MNSIFSIFILLSLTAVQARAAECQLSAVQFGGDVTKVSGTLKFTPEGDSHRLLVDIISQEPGKEPIQDTEEDLAHVLIYTNSTNPTAEEALENDDIGQIILRRLGSETPVELKIYLGKNFQDDNGGVMYYNVVGENGTSRGLVLLDWTGAYCD